MRHPDYYGGFRPYTIAFNTVKPINEFYIKNLAKSKLKEFQSGFDYSKGLKRLSIKCF